MQTLENIVQGTEAWLAIRKSHSTASEAPAALGKSKYTSRTELMNQKVSGIGKEIDSFTQVLFDSGHQAESQARALAEKIIQDDLYQVTATLDIEGVSLLASFDGCTIDESAIWEHKLFSKSLAEDVRAGKLDPHYTIQLDQQLLISGANKCLFMTSDGTEENMAWCWYEPSQEKFDALVSGWKQFHKDLANHVIAEEIAPVIAAPTMDLPALSIQVEGSISLISNLDRFGARLNQFVQDIDKSPTDDQGFADAELAIKTLEKAESALEAAESNALAQTASVDDMRKTVALYIETARTTRLLLQKMVKTRKESIRIEIVQAGTSAFADHVAALNKRLGKPYMPHVICDCASAIKGKKTISSLRDAVETELARAKIEANAIADKIEINLNSLRGLAKDYTFLFADTAQIIFKENDDLILLINSRIADHVVAEAAKLEKERARIQEEERIKAELAAEYKAKAEAAKVRAEAEAKAKAEADAKVTIVSTAGDDEIATTCQTTESDLRVKNDIELIKKLRFSSNQAFDGGDKNLALLLNEAADRIEYFVRLESELRGECMSNAMEMTK